MEGWEWAIEVASPSQIAAGSTPGSAQCLRCTLLQNDNTGSTISALSTLHSEA